MLTPLSLILIFRFSLDRFVFVKPHANTPATQKLVREKLVAAGCTILSEIDIDGQTIDEQKLIDQHYYAIGMCDDDS